MYEEYFNVISLILTRLPNARDFLGLKKLLMDCKGVFISCNTILDAALQPGLFSPIFISTLNLYSSFFKS